MEIADTYTPYERGVAALLERVGRDTPAHADLLVFQQRLTENIRQARLVGDTEQYRADRASVIAGLNALAQTTLAVDFNTLCGVSTAGAYHALHQPPRPSCDVVSGDKIAGDKVGGDKVMGEKRTINTEGGDYAEGNIDKRQGNFVSAGTVQGNVVGTNLGTVTANYYYQSAITPLDHQQQRNRRTMLAKVKIIWIEGLLEQPLAQELRIALNLTEQSDAVHLPLNALVQELRHPPRPLPSGIPIIRVFEQTGGALLILGMPGAGKTTLLLELTRDLIARAEQDEGHPIPVVFNLSSWAEKRRPLNEWLVEELNQRYDVPRKLAQVWIDSDGVLPLLDGLDEVAPDHRDGCVAAINSYRREEQGLLPLAVCSRVADYEALTIKLRLQSAVLVQPLTSSQVEMYLERAGDKLTGIRTALRDDAELGEMLATPLMLSIVRAVYKDNPLMEIQDGGTIDEQRRHIFDAYIAAMFGRRGVDTHYEPNQTTARLSWLARQMVQDHQTVFYIERMQPDIFRTSSQKVYQLMVGIFEGLIDGLIILMAVFGFGTGIGIELPFLAGSLFGFAGMTFLSWLVSIPTNRVYLNATPLSSGLALSRLASISLGACIWLTISGEALPLLLTDDTWGHFFAGITIGILASFILSLIAHSRTLHSNVEQRNSVTNISLIETIGRPTPARIVATLRNGALLGFGFNITYTTKAIGLQIDNNLRRHANYGVWRSAQNGIVFGVLAAACAFPLAVLLGAFIRWIMAVFPLPLFTQLTNLDSGGINWQRMIWVSISAGFWFSRALGGRAVVRHVMLRVILWGLGLLPLRLVPFLDSCAEHIFLRKIGGGYIFVHRMLMEYFALLDPQSLDTQSRDTKHQH